MKKTALACVALVAAFSLTLAHAAHRSSPDEARAHFDKAVAYVQENGAEQAAEAFNQAEGPFVRGDLYVFAFDAEGKYAANGGFPHLKGQPAGDLHNAAGQPVFELIMDAANSEELPGIAQYEWLNPQTNQLEAKSAYVQQVDGLVIGVGYYD